MTDFKKPGGSPKKEAKPSATVKAYNRVVVNQPRTIPRSSTTGSSASEESLGTADDGFQSRPFRSLIVLTMDPDEVTEFEELLRCIMCQNVPDPKCVMKCRKCHHFTCGPCAFSAGRESPPNSENGKEGCCWGTDLAKAPERFLSGFLGNSYWRCANWGNGCPNAIRGYEWEEHSESCQYKQMHRCYHRSCKYRSPFMKDVITHLLSGHRELIHHLTSDGVVNLRVPFHDSSEEPEFQTQYFAVLKFNGSHYVFGSEVSGDSLQMWVWDIQPDDALTKKCLFKLKPIGDHQEGEVVYSSTCVPYDKLQDRIIGEGNCFTVPLVKLRRNYLRQPTKKNDHLLTSYYHYYCYWKVALTIKEVVKNSN